jgi:hypothetical protein
MRIDTPMHSNLLAIAATTMMAIAGASPATAGPAHFVAPHSAPSGGLLTQHVVSGDFNGDGKTDLASANQGPSPLFGDGVGVTLGDGHGKLSAPVTTTLPDGMGACDLASGNFDDSGGTDLVVVTCTTGGYWVIESLTANGDGSFTVRQQIANSAKGQLASGDFNGDGIGDFAFSQQGTAQVSIFRGKGDGTFRAPVVKTVSFDSYDLEAGDVNGDGALDLVGAAGGPLWVMLNDGTGKFGAQIFNFDLSGLELALGQFDADGKLDVAVVDASGGHVTVGLGQGNGAFTAAAPIGPIGMQVNWIAAGDVTGDGLTDLVADVESNSSVVLGGDGTGAFPNRSYWVTGSEGLAVVDLDGKPPLDIASYSADPGFIHATLATPHGLRAPRLDRGPPPHVAVDLDNDGALDKISGEGDLPRPGVLRSVIVAQINGGSGRFGPLQLTKVRIETASSGIGAVAAGDIDEDGFADVVGGFSNFQASPHNLFWMLGRGDGTFASPTLSSTGDANADVDSIALGDVNGDGHLDLVSHTLSALSTRLGDGHGAFGAPVVSGFSGASQVATLLGDFTGDGVVDVVIVRLTGGEDFGSGAVDLEQGHGDGSFTQLQERTADSNLIQGGVADFDGDGRPDIATIGSAGFDGGRNALWILRTNAHGRLGAPVAYGGPSSGLAIADYDGDGAVDIAVDGIDAITVYENAGDATFAPGTSMLAAGGVAVAADFTGDGKPDLTGSTGVRGFELKGGFFALYVNATQ